MPSKKQQEGVNLFFDPEDGVDRFLLNACEIVPKYTESEPDEVSWLNITPESPSRSILIRHYEP